MKGSQSCLTLCSPTDYTVPGVLQARILEWVAFPFSRGSSRPRGRTQVSRTQVGSLLAEPQGKPKNTGVGSLSLLHWIFPTQESNWGLSHCRKILYQLCYRGSLRTLEWIVYPFSKRSSQLRNPPRGSCIAGGLFTS